ncbi:hypothetical protein [Sphingobacterium yanglingense]|uniref:Uncharacterized protein n=1 Tax=Sphingobacterium yanglingense TaxID=1437280 RepID=A0A4R6WHX3_9SPHI|nr:hypothetical protein [Sphingobacterium yanglingense]TDQ79754.1 hypothetical protein CLV99_1202 [Sphingobacterium yanglingense]
MTLSFIGTQELLILLPLVYGLFIVGIFYGLYKVLSTLLNRYLAAKREQTAALLLQSDALKEIASAVRESNDKNDTPPEII